MVQLNNCGGAITRENKEIQRGFAGFAPVRRGGVVAVVFHSAGLRKQATPGARREEPQSNHGDIHPCHNSLSLPTVVAN